MERKKNLGMMRQKATAVQQQQQQQQQIMEEGETDHQEDRKRQPELNPVEEAATEKRSNGDCDVCGRDDEIIKELNNIKKQNWITHCLLASMIVLTLTWQLSEVSLVLKIKQVVSNPLGSVGRVIRGLLKNSKEANHVQEMMKQTSERPNQLLQTTAFPGLKIPELPHWELPGLDTNDDEIE